MQRPGLFLADTTPHHTAKPVIDLAEERRIRCHLDRHDKLAFMEYLRITEGVEHQGGVVRLHPDSAAGRTGRVGWLERPFQICPRRRSHKQVGVRMFGKERGESLHGSAGGKRVRHHIVGKGLRSDQQHGNAVRDILKHADQQLILFLLCDSSELVVRVDVRLRDDNVKGLVTRFRLQGTACQYTRCGDSDS